MDKEEVGLVIQNLMTKLGKGFDADEFADLTEGTPAFDFFLFLNPLEIWYFHDQEVASVGAVIKDLWLQVKSDVIKRGVVNRRGLAVTGWKRRWLTLVPGYLDVHASEAAAEASAGIANSTSTESSSGGSKTMRINLSPDSSVEALPANNRLGPFAVPHAFCLKNVIVENIVKDSSSSPVKDNKRDSTQPTKKSSIEFGVGHFREKNEWVTGIRRAIEDRGRGNQSKHRRDFVKRRSKRRDAEQAEAQLTKMKELLRRKSQVVKVDLELEKKKRKEEEEEKERVRKLHEEEKKRREELQVRKKCFGARGALD